MTKKITVVTGIRSEYNLLYPIMKAMQEHPDLELSLVVTGAHLSDTYGHTIEEIKKDGFEIVEQIESLLDANSASSRIKSTAIQLMGLVQTFTRLKPDIVIAPFDREEAINVALAGTYMNIPIAHIGGGDRVVGNVDDHIRHAVSKLAHIHFPTTQKNAERLIKMGEESWRVHCVGNPGLDNYLLTEYISPQALSEKLDFEVTERPLILLIQHPVSTEIEECKIQMEITMEAIKDLKYRTVAIYPNSDGGGRGMIKVIDKYSSELDLIKAFENLPRDIFVSLMKTCDVLVGNSSCGITEAPFIKLPTVNIGTREREREHAENVIFVANNKEEIKAAIKKALYDEEFKEVVKKCKNPYGDGRAGERIVEILSKIKLDKKILQKKITY